MAKAGVVEIEVRPELSGFGARIDQFSRNLRPLGIRTELAGDVGADIDRQRAAGQRSLDTLNTQRARREFEHLGDTGQRQVSRIGAEIKGLSGGTLVALGAGTTAVGARIVSSLRPATEAASGLGEAVAFTAQVFGRSAGDIEQWADTASESVLLSKRAALDAANTFATFGKAAGLAGDDLVKFSTDLSQLAADMASAKDTSVEDAVTAIGAALRGETEPIRNYGVLLDDALLRQEAMALGITKTTKEALTPQQKVLATNSLLWKGTADIQGDVARNADSMANSLKRAAADSENAQAKLGEGLTPVVAAAARTFSTFLDVLDRVPGATTALGVSIAGIGSLAILGGATTSILGGVRAIREFRTGAVEAAAASTAGNQAITASATQAAAATASMATAYDAVAVAATRAGTAGVAANTAQTAAGVGTAVTLSRQWQYATPRVAGALGPGVGAGLATVGPIIDATSREVPALNAGAASSAAAAGRLSTAWKTASGSVSAFASTARSALGSIPPVTAALAAGTVAALGFGSAWSQLKNQTAEGLEGLAVGANQIRASLDPESARAFALNVVEVGRVLGELDEVGPLNAVDKIRDVFGTYGDGGNRAKLAADQIKELQSAIDAMSTDQARTVLTALIAELDRTGSGSDETRDALDRMLDELDDRDAIDRATTSVAELGDEVEQLGVKIDPTASKWQNFATVLGGIFDPIQNAINAQEALSDGQKSLADAQRKYEDIVNGNTEAVKSAAEGLQEARKALDEAVAKTGPGSRAARDAAQEVRDALRAYRELQVEAGKTREGDFFEDYTEDFRAAEDRIRDAAENLRAIESGNTEEVRAARERLADATTTYNEALAETGPNSEAARDALEEVEDQQRRVVELQREQEEAAAALREQLEEHPEAIDASIQKVDEWVARGLISVAVAEQWKKELWAAANEAQRLNDNLPGTSAPPRGPGTPGVNQFPGGQGPPRPTATAANRGEQPRLREMTAQRAVETGLVGSFYEYATLPDGTRRRGTGGNVWTWNRRQEKWTAFFHQGGKVRGLGEVDATLLGGEGVVNRAGMARLGDDGLDALNRGLDPSTDQIAGLRADFAAFFAWQMRNGGQTDASIPLLQQQNDLLRRMLDDHRSPASVRAGALEFA